jgi:hypothetical protein
MIELLGGSDLLDEGKRGSPTQAIDNLFKTGKFGRDSMAFTQAHALIIGVGTHQYAPHIDVPITVADAKSVKDVLLDDKTCGYPSAQVTLLENSRASKDGILAALSELAKRVKTEDTVFFYYCGHGALGTDGNYYLVSHDAKIRNGRVVQGTGISQNELIEKLRTVAAKRVLMIFNACFSGNISPSLDIGEQNLEASGLSEDVSNALLGTGQGRIIITACREDQKSYIGSGALTIFTQALVDGLKGRGVANSNGYISAYSLYEHVYETVSETVQEQFNLVQEPELTVLKGIGPFAVALYKGATSLGDLDIAQPVPDLPAVRQVKAEKARKALGRHIDTGGGAYIEGDVHITGGDFVGRDKHVYGDKSGADKKI